MGKLYIMSRYDVDVFTDLTVESKFPENSYDCDTVEAVAEIIKNCTRKISGIKKIEVWINEYDDTC